MAVGPCWKIVFGICLWSAVVLRTCSGDAEAHQSAESPISNTISPLRLEDLKNNELGEWVAPKYIREAFPYYVSGYDDEGRPIIIYEFGKYNFKAALARGEDAERDVTRYWDQSIWNIEKLAAENAQDSGPGEVVLFYDFDGFTLDHVSSVAVSRFALKMFSKFGTVIDKVGYGFFINTNFLSGGFLNAARPLLGSFLERFEQYGSRKEAWLPRVLRKLPRDQLPPWYGGEKDFTPVVILG